MPQFIPYTDRFEPGCPAEQAARKFYECMAKRRSIRAFSDRPVSRETVAWLIKTAGASPSGANKQPWRFVCVSNPDIKRKIRIAAEAEERAFYNERAGEQWLKDLEPLGTDANKEFLEVAPWLIVIFKLVRTDDDTQVYYINESVGIAAGMFLAAAHHAGLATLTHTPSPMKFLSEVLGRPDYERPYLLIPLGYPADGCEIPVAATERKPLDQIMVVED